MSSVYATEPATSGRVLMETTHGPLQIDLWCRECPSTTKLFLQLCLDGFYDNMIFHRIVPNFLIQTGIMRSGSEVKSKEVAMEKYRQALKADYALERVKYELHSRLRFSHRGQVAMALTVDTGKDQEEESEQDRQELQPQFFVTLEEAAFLDGKHVLFGTISGPTFFNALRIGTKVPVDEATHQPQDLQDAPRITSVKIVDNPLHQDIVPQSMVPWRLAKEKEEKAKKKKKKRKGKLDVNVLSFGDEMEEGVAQVKKTKPQSAVPKEEASNDGDDESGAKKKKKKQKSTVEEEKKEADPAAATTASDKDVAATTAAPAPSPDATAVTNRKDKADEPNEEPDRVVADKEPKENGGLSALEARRAKYAGTKGVSRKSYKRQRDEDTMAKLEAFQSKIKSSRRSSKSSGAAAAKNVEDNGLASRMARREAQEAEEARKKEKEDGEDDAIPTYRGQVLDNDDDDDASDWLGGHAKWKRHRDTRTSGGDGRDMEEYKVIDDGRHHKREKKEKRKRHHHHK